LPQGFSSLLSKRQLEAGVIIKQIHSWVDAQEQYIIQQEESLEKMLKAKNSPKSDNLIKKIEQEKVKLLYLELAIRQLKKSINGGILEV
jgi:hypothetical protein